MVYQVNDKIRLRSFLVVDDSGNKFGELTKPEALMKAQEMNLDLVLISPNSSPAVAKIMDYGKFLYEQKKKEKRSRKNQNQVKVKEIYVKPNIGEHDLNWRADNAKKWLTEGNRVKFTVQTYGRLTLHEDLVFAIYERFLKLIGDLGKPEDKLKKINPKNHEVIIIPTKK